MNQPTVTNSAPEPVQAIPSLYAVLVKMRLSLLVVMTSGVGFIMASGDSIAWIGLLWTVVGTLLCACSANGLNQVIENRRDALMERTRNRPVPSGAMSAQHGWIFTMVLGYGGLCMLALLVNLPAAGLALITMLTYVVLYTPLKARTTLNTLIGAVVGAIPPMIGWVAASGTITTGAWILAAILFVWQLPHFLSLAWMYREDYARGGFKMLPGIKGGEHTTCEVVVLTTLLLIPLGLTATMVGITGVFYAFCSIALGIMFTLPAIKFFRERNRDTARRVFLTSILYLPVLMLAMVVDRGQAFTTGQTAVLTLQEVDAVSTPAPNPEDGS